MMYDRTIPDSDNCIEKKAIETGGVAEYRPGREGSHRLKGTREKGFVKTPV